MGCGKTSVGKRAAKLLGRQFCDLDSYIERKAGMTVSEIFAQEGEAGFRARETQAAEEVAPCREWSLQAGAAQSSRRRTWKPSTGTGRKSSSWMFLWPPYRNG